MDWPVPEQERILRLFLRQSQPALGLEWCQKDVFTALFPKDVTVPIKWTMYELVAKTLQDGGALHVKDPMFARAVEVLRMQQDAHAQEDAALHHDSLLSHELPHLLSQYAALSLVASDALVTKPDALSEVQQASLKQAEVLWRDSLAWVEQLKSNGPKDELATGVDASFEACIQTNLGELLLRMNRTEEATELLGKALQTQQQEKGGNALALSRVLSKIAQACHMNDQAVSSEGLFTSVLDGFEKEPHLSLTDQVEYALALRAYSALLNNWEKRERDAQLKLEKAQEVERAIAAQCASHKCAAPLHPVFYLPL
jgi:tetratricopeptide (TPR) repeat protein